MKRISIFNHQDYSAPLIKDQFNSHFAMLIAMAINLKRSDILIFEKRTYRHELVEFAEYIQVERAFFREL